jgi:hypothetical protein
MILPGEYVIDIEYFNMCMENIRQEIYERLWETGIHPMFLTDPDIIMDDDDEDKSCQKIFWLTHYKTSITSNL